MKKSVHQLVVEEYNGIQDLPPSDRALMQLAIEAAQGAYAPYSSLKVGAAVLLENGERVIGSNQENAAFPSGLCAERVAIFAASAHFPAVAVKAIAIAAFSENTLVERPITPCGACRQALIEYEFRNRQEIRIILKWESGKYWIIEGVKNLLPLAFTKDQMA